MFFCLTERPWKVRRYEIIRSFKKYLPGCEKKMILQGSGKFVGWESMKAALRRRKSQYRDKKYDKRTDSENLICEAKREGLSDIVSNKFATNYAYF
ncbi:MAG: hypothetical protein AYP45_03705 [Candidatus Brocadia carolinensis]|uniref:Uncharacterized protein n=1 Tax=Candidatus Brocadia carolinensis TaxID=1004156 RepID=A0A1V4AW25_9BACT|nr:MAG: hypothetical protein AYP45_03705 [Candidatus Brocadia caroliniensis]